MSLRRLLSLITPGEPVTAGVANRAPRELHGDINFLWEVLQAAELGSTVYARCVTIETDAQVGMPVYFNKTRRQFERGLAKLDTAPSSGVLQTADDAKIWGIVAEKHNATLADVLLFGYAAIDISAAVSGTVEAGTYYLSGSTPGRLVKTAFAVSVPVLESDGEGNVYVRAQMMDIVNRHTHYKFPLACKAAGDTSPPVMGEKHVISGGGDVTLSGWLPAGHASFNGRAPAGAVFGYNFTAHTALQNAWPPLPTSQAWLEWNKALDKDVGFTGVPLGMEGQCVIDRYGIWWMSDCYGDVPWPISYDSTNSVSYSDSVSAECPRNIEMEMCVFFSKAEFATDTLVVRSLRSPDPRIIVRCIDGSSGSAGDLEIFLDLDLVSADGERGYQAFKTFDGKTFKRGPIVEGIYSTSENVTCTGDAESALDVALPNGQKVQHGFVRIEVSQYPTRELPVTFVDLRGGVEEQHFEDINYYGLPSGEQTNYRGRIKVPADATLQAPQLQLRLTLLGRALGDLPALTVTARRIPRTTFVDDASVPAALPLTAAEFAVTIDTVATLASPNEYVEVTSEAFSVEAGDVVFFTVQRDVDDYDAEVGVLDHVGVLSAT